jgi:hypothetical protein
MCRTDAANAMRAGLTARTPWRGRPLGITLDRAPRPAGDRRVAIRENDMAKGQMRSTKEKRKPKQEKKEKAISAYKQAYSTKPGGTSVMPPPIKKEG